jgi:putative transposase
MTALAVTAGAAQLDAAQIASVLGVTRRTVERRAAAESWPYTATAQRGGHKRWYALASLPPDVRAALALADAKAVARERAALAQQARAVVVQQQAQQQVQPQAQAAAVAVPAQAGTAGTALVWRGQKRRVAGPEDMTDKDRRVVDATLLLCQGLDEVIAETGSSNRQACIELAQRICDGRASGHLVQAAQATYLRPRDLPNAQEADPQRVGGQGPLALRLQRLHSFYRKGLAEGDPARYLVPARTPKRGEKVAHVHKVAFLLHYCRPARPTVKSAWRESAAWYSAQGVAAPAYDTFARLGCTLPMLVKNRGRMTGAAWRALNPYVERDVSMFKANDIWVGDGHTFKATVQSPIHGRAFRPEVTAVLDWVSRKIVGYSVDLAESTIAVSAAFRDAQLRTRARPLVYYSDNGSGQTGKLIDCDVHGTLARQGIAHETGIPGNPQGRGVIERLWSSTLIELASTYATYVGSRADPETARVVAQQVAKDQRAGRFSAVVPPWEKFLADLDATVAAYNSRAHSSLGKAHPDQVYAERLDPDSVVFAVGDEEINALWMPEARRTPRRGLIELFNNTYFMPGLAETLAEGEEVRVRFDIHRAETVWVLDMQGRLLGRAQWNGHRRAAFPVAYIEAKREERVNRKVGKKLGEAELARDELMHTVDARLEAAPATDLPLPAITPRPAAQPEGMGSYMDTLVLLGQRQQAHQGPPAPEEQKVAGSVIDTWAQVQQVREARLARQAAEAAAADGFEKKVAEG